MPIDRKQTRWNGWGWEKAHNPLEGREAAWDWIAQELQTQALPHTPAVKVEDIELRAPRLSAQQRGALSALAELRDDAGERLSHARGKSYFDLLKLRAGDVADAPDGVVYPRNSDEVVKILAWAARERVAVVPFAGGSSVVGGLTASAGAFQAVIALDLTGLNKLLSVDKDSLTATAEAGIYGVDLEAALKAQGYKHGHHPQSFEFSTLGGWVAASGAGQQSNAYGRAGDWFAGAEVATANGLWRLPNIPASGAGPDLRHLIVGSEGAFGVITEATVRIHPVPEASDYAAYLFADFECGARAIRLMVQRELPTATMRLSDADETYFFQAFGKAGAPPGLKEKLQASYLTFRGLGERPCAMILGFEGHQDRVDYGVSAARKIIRSCQGVAVGRGPAARWYAGRFHGPYSRDPMMDRGLGVDTLETATTWGNLKALYGEVRRALEETMRAQAPTSGARGIVLAHISHAYHDGASLYFTYVWPRNLIDPITQWRAIKGAASDAIVRAGGTITHHHGVGEDHLPWLQAEKGVMGMNVLRAVKRELDPAGVMNPGKLVE